MKRLANFTAMSGIRFRLAYLLHRFTAINRHGLHSPFIYRLVDEVIYDFSDKKEYLQIEEERKRLLNDQSQLESSILKHSKLVRLIYRLIADRRPESIIEMGKGREIRELYAQVLSVETGFYAPENYALKTHPDLIWINNNDILKNFEWVLTKVGNGTVIVVNDIHRTKNNREAWNAIKANPQVTATVDLFWIGLVFFRKGQVKEDFRIRF